MPQSRAQIQGAKRRLAAHLRRALREMSIEAFLDAINVSAVAEAIRSDLHDTPRAEALLLEYNALDALLDDTSEDN